MFQKKRLHWLKSKLGHYASELRFALHAPVGVGESCRLIWATLVFHYRNWQKAPADPNPKLRITLKLAGRPTPITVRPHDGDISILYEVFARASYEIAEDRLEPQSVRTIIDIGANIGLASLYFAARYPNAIIYSVEPNPDNAALLRINASRETRIVPVEACITGEPAKRVFITTAGRGSHHQMNSEGIGVGVRGMSVDELCREFGISHIDLLKIDAEGAEKEIFADGSFLPMTGLVVAELHGGYDLDCFNHDLAAWGFRAEPNDQGKEDCTFIADRAPPSARDG